MAGTPPALTLYGLAFEASPIILTGGIASLMGGMLPIIVLTEALNFIGGILSGGESFDIADLLAHFHPVSGTGLLENQIGKYTFFNRAVAANAIIKQPVNISFRMTCPAKGDGGMLIKTATFIALRATLDQHNQMGGTYTLLTPTGIYPNSVLLRLADASQGGTNQSQTEFQWDFEQPLLTQADLQSVQSNVMQLLGNGGQITGTPSWSGVLTGIGSSLGIPTPGLIPGASAVQGSAIAPIGGISNTVPQ